MTPAQLIASLNAITVGDIHAILQKLEEARAACADLGHPAIVDVLVEARKALLAGDLKLYRKRIETAVSRLGHLKG